MKDGRINNKAIPNRELSMLFFLFANNFVQLPLDLFFALRVGLLSDIIKPPPSLYKH